MFPPPRCAPFRVSTHTAALSGCWRSGGVHARPWHGRSLPNMRQRACRGRRERRAALRRPPGPRAARARRGPPVPRGFAGPPSLLEAASCRDASQSALSCPISGKVRRARCRWKRYERLVPRDALDSGRARAAAARAAGSATTPCRQPFGRGPTRRPRDLRRRLRAAQAEFKRATPRSCLVVSAPVAGATRPVGVRRAVRAARP
jgi:hypothetical protein